MARPIRTLAAFVLAGLMTAAAGTAAQADAPQPTRGEERLARMLEGRVPGAPESCIRSFPTMQSTVIDGTAIVFRQGNTLWVNVPRDARFLADSDALLTRTFGNRLCNTDIVHTYDTMIGMQTGTVFLTDFVPYRRVRTAS